MLNIFALFCIVSFLWSMDKQLERVPVYAMGMYWYIAENYQSRPKASIKFLIHYWCFIWTPTAISLGVYMVVPLELCVLCWLENVGYFQPEQQDKTFAHWFTLGNKSQLQNTWDSSSYWFQSILQEGLEVLFLWLEVFLLLN